MVDLTMSPDFDEGVFQAYLMVGRSIVVDSGDKAQLRRLADKFSDGLSAFNASWQLSTGLSMETLWRLLRPPLAKNIAQLECGLQVEKLADQFDTLKWTVGASIQELDSFRRSMILFHNRMNVFETHDDESLRVSEHSKISRIQLLMISRMSKNHSKNSGNDYSRLAMLTCLILPNNLRSCANMKQLFT